MHQFICAALLVVAVVAVREPDCNPIYRGKVWNAGPDAASPSLTGDGSDCCAMCRADSQCVMYGFWADQSFVPGDFVCYWFYTDVSRSDRAIGLASKSSFIGEAPCKVMCDDPHFLGLDNVRYNFMGEADKVFNLVSDSTFELNSKFTSEPCHRFNHTSVNMTFLGPTCIKTCNQRMIVYPNRTMFINGRHVYTSPDPTLNHYVSPELEARLVKNHVMVTIPGRWEFEIVMLEDRINIISMTPLGEHGTTQGIIGHTLNLTHPVLEENCNSRLQGGCEVQGDYHDYIVQSDDLCASSWKNSLYDEDACDY